MLKKFFGICFCFFLFSTAASAATYYVDGNSGNDTNTGSISNPFKTIQKGVNSASAGDTIIVKPGVYYGPINITQKGTLENPITLCADNEGKGENQTIITNANQAIRQKTETWTQYNSEKNIWVIDYTAQKNIAADGDIHLCPARVLVNDADIMSYQSLATLVSGVYSTTDDSMSYTPGYPQGYYYDKPAGKLYVRLRTDGKYGSSNPNECLMKVAPSRYPYISNSSGYGGAGYNGDAMGTDSYNICVGNYYGGLGTGSAAENYYVVIDGFTLETPGYAGIYCRASNVTIKNCWFKGCRTAVRGAARSNHNDFIYSNNITVEHCDWSAFPAYDDAMELLAKCSDSNKSDFEFADTELAGYHLAPYYWWQRKGNEMSLSYEVGGFTNYMGEKWTIRYNHIHDCFDGISYRAMLRYTVKVDGYDKTIEARYIDIYGNVFENCIDNAIEVEDHGKDIYIHNNYFHNIPCAISIQPFNGTPWPTNIKIYKNVFFNTRDFNQFFNKATVTQGTPEGQTVKIFKLMIEKKGNWQVGYPWMIDYPMTDGRPTAIDFEDEGIKIFNNTIINPSGGLLSGVGSGTWDTPYLNFHFLNNAVVCNVNANKPTVNLSEAKTDIDIEALLEAEFRGNYFASDSNIMYRLTGQLLNNGGKQLLNANSMGFENITRQSVNPELMEDSPLRNAGVIDRYEPASSRDIGALSYAENFDISNVGPQY